MRAAAELFIVSLGDSQLSEIIEALPMQLAIAVSLCLTAAYLPIPLASLVDVCLPLLSGFILFSNATIDIETTGSAPIRKTAPAFAGVAGLIALVVVFSISAGYLDSSTSFGFSSSLYYLFLTLASLAFCFIFIVTKGSGLVGKTIIVPCLLLVIVTVPFTALIEKPIFTSFLSVGVLCSEIILLVLPVCYAKFASMQATQIYAITRLLHVLFNELGVLLATWAFSSDDILLTSQLTTILVFAGIEALLAIIVVFFLSSSKVFREDAKDKQLFDEDDSAVLELSPKQEAAAQYEERCREFAETYKLTSREAEVMLLLSKGHSAAKIRQMLFLAESTVRFHTRNVYAKTGVHSRQELIDAVQRYVDNDA